MKKILILIFSLFVSISLFTNVYADNTQKVVDEVDYLTDEQETELNNLIDDYINKTNYDIVIYLTDEVGDYFNIYSEDDAITALADDYYDNNNYGIGDSRDGLILCVVFGEETIGYNTYTITTCGNSCIDTYNDRALNRIYNDVTYDFSNRNFIDGLETFIEDATYVYDNYDDYHYEPVVVSDSYSYMNALIPALFPAIFVGIIAAVISFFVLKAQLKHTGVSHNAGNYVSDHRVDILRSGEIYLYTTRRRIKIERHEPNHSSSSSSTHTSSSGVRHGGGGSHRF